MHIFCRRSASYLPSPVTSSHQRQLWNYARRTLWLCASPTRTEAKSCRIRTFCSPRVPSGSLPSPHTSPPFAGEELVVLSLLIDPNWSSICRPSFQRITRQDFLVGTRALQHSRLNGRPRRIFHQSYGRRGLRQIAALFCHWWPEATLHLLSSNLHRLVSWVLRHAHFIPALTTSLALYSTLNGLNLWDVHSHLSF